MMQETFGKALYGWGSNDAAVPKTGIKLVIIGGVAGGASAAARARRLDETCEIVLLQSGPDVSFASCGMPYFIGGECTDRDQMAVQTPESLRKRFNIDVHVNTRVTKIDTDNKTVTATDETQPGSQTTIAYDELVLAVGSEPLKPPIPGIGRKGLFALRNLQDMDAIVEWLNDMPNKCSTCSEYGNKVPLHAVVAGAGFVGLEMVEQLMRRGLEVTVVEMLPQVLGPLDVEMAAIIEDDLKAKGVNVVTGDGIQEFLPFNGNEHGDDPSTVVKLKSGTLLPPAQITILGMGVRPDTKVVAEAGIECTPRGHIVVNDYLQTNKASVWAAGDAIEVLNPIVGNGDKWAVPLAGPANRQGRMIADNIFGGEKKMRKFKGTYAASVVRVFELIGACVGMNEKMLSAKQLPFASVHVHPGSHAGYFPGAKSVNFKLLFHPTTGQIWGAQAVGEEGVEKRIDVISTAMQGNLTVEDLAELELCYAPPVGSAKDPVNIAGMAALNVLEGLVEQVDWKELKKAASLPGVVILDVRNPGEIEKSGPLIEGCNAKTINIPLDNLRARVGEIPADTERIIVSCASGQRAYYACRILMQTQSAKVENLSGAFKTFSRVSERV
ncbi:CoA-disulfide reductase [Skeletonema marinoi]|uniref:CoA-disulfide reductase n=1 Tax=Skeletonema marinoi TaxID=267567 RepID=A0AAD9DAA3_9STRA|nr:CoA-disulfide reductase [Skeletonema marinoi]